MFKTGECGKNMSSEKPEDLIRKYLNNSCTPEERAILESWYNKRSKEIAINKTGEDLHSADFGIKNLIHNDPSSVMSNSNTEIDYDHTQKEIWNAINKQTTINKSQFNVPKRNWYYFSAAASIIFICFIFWFSNFFLAHKQSSISTAQTIQPGSNKAELILADGSIIAIAEKENGIVANQDNSHIVKNGNGQIVYSEAQSNHSSPADDTGQANNKIVYNTLRTPKGGQYQVVLTDGTRVWLNAASSITFPTVFSGLERIVEASGEAYFEVAKNPKKPFKVISKGHVITVLGTHFNLYAYAEDPYVKTTLLEGSVQVSAHNESVIIKPGQQSTYDVNNQKLSTRTINAEGAIAWKEGYFEFNNEDLPTIMKKLSRWYDIDVQYDKTFVNQRFNGSVSRFEDAAKVLKMLEYTGTVHFKINGRRIVVMP